MTRQRKQGALLNNYLHGAGIDEMVARFGGLGSRLWYCQDGRGNTSHVIDDSGGLVESYTYDLGGNPFFYNSSLSLVQASITGNRFLYNGRDYGFDTKLYDYRNRFYHPGTSRFLQTDPISSAGGNNLYSYCGNNPANFRDPLGLQEAVSPRITVTGGPTDDEPRGGGEGDGGSGSGLGGVMTARGEPNLGDGFNDSRQVHIQGPHFSMSLPRSRFVNRPPTPTPTAPQVTATVSPPAGQTSAPSSSSALTISSIMNGLGIVAGIGEETAREGSTFGRASAGAGKVFRGTGIGGFAVQTVHDFQVLARDRNANAASIFFFNTGVGLLAFAGPEGFAVFAFVAILEIEIGEDAVLDGLLNHPTPRP